MESQIDVEKLFMPIKEMQVETNSRMVPILETGVRSLKDEVVLYHGINIRLLTVIRHLMHSFLPCSKKLPCSDDWSFRSLGSQPNLFFTPAISFVLEFPRAKWSQTLRSEIKTRYLFLCNANHSESTAKTLATRRGEDLSLIVFGRQCKTSQSFTPARKIRARLSKEIGQIPKKLPSFSLLHPNPCVHPHKSSPLPLSLLMPRNQKKTTTSSSRTLNPTQRIDTGMSGGPPLGPGGGGIARKDSLDLRSSVAACCFGCLSWPGKKSAQRSCFAPLYPRQREGRG